MFQKLEKSASCTERAVSHQEGVCMYLVGGEGAVRSVRWPSSTPRSSFSCDVKSAVGAEVWLSVLDPIL